MDYIRLGKSDLLASRTAFGAMRLAKSGDEDDVAVLVKHAYDRGVNFFDTSRAAGDSEKLLGSSLSPVRQNVIIATKSQALTGELLAADIDESLAQMKLDCIDLYQFETKNFLPSEDSSDGIYDALLDAQDDGKIKRFGIVTEDIDTAEAAVKSGLWETLQFPFNALTDDRVGQLVELCEKTDTGFIAMQPLCGGLIRDLRLAFAFIYKYENAIPVWGARNLEELDQILELGDIPPAFDEKLAAEIAGLRAFFN